MAATNTSNDPFVNLRVGAAGIDTRVYRNLTVTSAYDGPFDLRDIAGGGTMARVVWGRRDGASGQTDDVLTYSGSRTVTIDMGMPTGQLVEPGTGSAPFLSGSPVTALRWDPERGSWRAPLVPAGRPAPVGLRDHRALRHRLERRGATTRVATATLVADTDRSGCNGTTVAAAVPVNPGNNTTVWNTRGVTGGRYWLCLKITRNGAVSTSYAGGVLVVGSTPPGPPVDPNPVGSFDVATLTGHAYRFAGWAFDPDTPGQPIYVDVYDRRPDGSQVGTRFATGGSRPDVAAAYPGVGGNTGFTGSIQLTGAGRHSVCFIAINVGPGSHRQLACRDVDAPGPIGSLDLVTSNGPSTLGVAGWALDADAARSAIGVHFYVTGPAGSAFGATRTAGARPDVAAAFSWAGPNTGFTATVPAAGAGTNRVCAYAINAVPPSTNPLIGCLDVRVP